MPQKKKILHIIQSLGNGGWENALLRTLPLLDDFEHEIITLREPGELASKFISAGIPVKTIDCKSLLDISGLFRLCKLIRGGNQKIVLTYLFHADVFGRLILRFFTKAPIIPFLGTTYNYPRYFFARLFERISKPLAFHYLANSEAVKDAYIKNLGVEAKKITVIPTGIDIKHFDSVIPDPELRKSLGIKPDDFVVICVANLHISKGHRYLLEAFEALSSQHHNIKLLLVGDGTERKNLEQQISSYQNKQNILFLGRRTDVPQLLKISNVFVLPTLFEGMSNAIMEAMACELPVVTTDIPENKILIKNNESGILVPTRSSQDLSNAISTLIRNTDLSKKLGGSGKEFLEQSISLEISVSLLRRFMNSL